jgi:hypothetical protein
MNNKLISMGIEPFRTDRFEHVLLGDVVHAHLRLCDDDTEVHRREMVRACFSAIEGMFFLMKQSFLDHPNCSEILSIHERAALSEESYQVAKNGRVTLQTRYTALPSMYKFLIRLAERTHPEYCNDTINARSWNAFLGAHGVRNRLTHPKDLDDLKVSRKEANTCLAAVLRVVVLAVDIATLNRQWAEAEISRLSPEFPNPFVERDIDDPAHSE